MRDTLYTVERDERWLIDELTRFRKLILPALAIISAELKGDVYREQRGVFIDFRGDS